MLRRETRNPLIWVALPLILAACAQPQASSAIDSGLVASHVVTIKGQRYTVHRVTPGENLFAVRTADGLPGDRRAMGKVVRLAYDCFSLSLRETKPDWREAEARGAICNGGHQRFRRGR